MFIKSRFSCLLTFYKHNHTLIVLSSIAFFFFSQLSEAKYSGGTGELNNPYQIATTNDLISLGESTEDYDKHFILTVDIDLDPNLTGGRIFTQAIIAPDTNDISNHFQGIPFTGVFDGNGHTISNLTIEGKGYLGLFGKLEDSGANISGVGANISNLTLDKVDINGTENYVGGLVGYNDVLGSISNCCSKGMIIGNEDVGGLVGYNYIGFISNCYSHCTVNGDNRIGGLVGNNNYGGGISDCSSRGIVIGDEDVGGLVGYSFTSRIFNSYSSCKVTGSENVGGLIGYNGFTTIISNNYIIGTVTGDQNVGGLAGYNYVGTISNSYSSSIVIGNEDVGGLVGETQFGTITTSYSTGNVSGNKDTGGLVGYKGYFSEVTMSFWDIETSGLTSSDGGIGKTTIEMKQQSNFINWDFVNVWDIGEKQTYPYLRTYSLADLNKDNIINFHDLSILAENWMEEK